jgi:hypothetical protein
MKFRKARRFTITKRSRGRRAYVRLELRGNRLVKDIDLRIDLDGLGRATTTGSGGDPIKKPDV